MIKLTNVSKTYTTKAGQISALEDINLTVNPGEIYGVIGRSGAGKSTLIRCVNLLERPTSGSVMVNRHEMTTLSERELREERHRIGMVFQHFNLLSTRTVYDNVALPLQLLKKSSRDIEFAVKPLLELTGLAHRAESYPSQLSGGQKQRVAIARALATKPRVLLCDEMTSALDPETTTAILELVKDINEQMQLSILLITHEMGVIKTIADHVAVLDDGRIIEQSDVVSLFKNPKTAIAKSFTESVFNRDLPELMGQKLRDQYQKGDHSVIRLTFTGHAAAEPVISGLLRQFSIIVNILQANLEFLRLDTIGTMVLTMQGSEEDIKAATSALKQKDLTVEVLGYVAADDELFG